MTAVGRVQRIIAVSTGSVLGSFAALGIGFINAGYSNAGEMKRV